MYRSANKTPLSGPGAPRGVRPDCDGDLPDLGREVQHQPVLIKVAVQSYVDLEPHRSIGLAPGKITRLDQLPDPICAPGDGLQQRQCEADGRLSRTVPADEQR